MLFNYTKSILIFWNLILLIGFKINLVKCANILGLLPAGSPSHSIWNSVIMYKLAEIGHNVTVLSPDLPQNPKEVPRNVHYIHLEEVYNTMYNSSSDESIDINAFIGVPPHNEIPKFYDFAMLNNKGVINSKGFKQLLNYPDNFKFDLVIFDYTVGEIILGFLHKFKYPPLIGISAFLLPPNTFDYVGGHYHPSYIPFHSYAVDTNMNFGERLYNTYLYALDTVCRYYFYYPQLNELLREHFSKHIESLTDLRQRMIIAMVNSHPAINYPQSIPPNVIEIGGVQVQDPKPLDKDLEEFASKSKKGVILFSLGTNMKPQDVGTENTNVILKTLENFPDYNFFWKFDSSFIKRKIPKNVLIRTFFPQRDILAHPKLKLFITHAGGLSTQEATWRGVPMVGIPLFVDQHRNLHKSVLAGVAVKVDYPTMTTDSLTKAIHEVLTNKSYAENMRIRSESFRDRPMKPLDTAVWWIEYVLRHPEPKHLKSPVPQLGFFIANSYDVVVFVLITFLFVIWFLFKIFNFIFLQIRSQKQIIKNEKKNK